VRILVTNDDGIDSVGLHHLARAMQDLGDVVVVAPDVEYSGASAALGALNVLRPEVHRQDLGGIQEAWSVGGPPALCVLFARLGLFGDPFDLVVAGINPGANVGRAVYHSGTVGAAVTARAGGVSGVAVSQAVEGFGIEGQASEEMLGGQRWETAAVVARSVVRALLHEVPPEPLVVNLNVPNLPLQELDGWRPARLGNVAQRSVAAATLEAQPGHVGSYRVRMRWGEHVSLPEGTDGGEVDRGRVSFTLLGPMGESDPAMAPQVQSALGALLES
jgi:5'-nucleotidase